MHKIIKRGDIGEAVVEDEDEINLNIPEHNETTTEDRETNSTVLYGQKPKTTTRQRPHHDQGEKGQG